MIPIEILSSPFFLLLLAIIVHYVDKWHRQNKKLEETLRKTYDQSTGEPVEERHTGRRRRPSPSDPMDEYMRHMNDVERYYQSRSIEMERVSIMRRQEIERLKREAYAPPPPPSKPKPSPPETDIFSISEQFKDLT